MCPHCRAFITASDKVCPYCNESVGPRAVERRGASQEMLAGFIPQAHFTTIVILVINFGLYAATAIYGIGAGLGSAMDLDGRILVLFGSKYVPYIAEGQWWRLVTAGFLHGGLMHILMNSWALFDLGAAVEEAYGTARLLVIYFVSSVAGFYASAVWSRSNSVGASAALCGLLGAMIALGLRDRSALADAMRGMYVRWLVFIMVISFVVPNVDMAAHVGGLAAGFGLAYLSGQPRRPDAITEKLWRVAAVFCFILTAASFFLWFLWFRQVSA